ncbi:MAG: RNA polymerase sigma factor [Bacteroidetes bacterium]|nr:RNA polymerase sigma factor [Bacteroidota bacterium]
MRLRYTDEELLDGLRKKKDYFIQFLYNEYGPIIRHFVRQNSGNVQDVEDILQDSLIVLFASVRLPSFKLDSSLKTYFIAISKNLWLQRLERKYRLMYQADWEVNEPVFSYSPDEDEIKEENLERQRLFFKHLSELPQECRRLLELYCLKVPYREIARLMNYKDEIYVKTRKYSCKNLLRKNIMNDPDYQQFLDYDENRNYKQLD